VERRTATRPEKERASPKGERPWLRRSALHPLALLKKVWGRFGKIRRRPARGNDHTHPENSTMPRRSHRKRARRTAKPGADPARPPPSEIGADSPTLESRMKAAGFRKDDAPHDNIDAMRTSLARRINMLINNWRGCPEPLCRRMSGCMAPRIRCTNAPPRKEDPERTARTMALVYRALRESPAREAAEEGE
jgi:hypothetical protein